MIKIGLADGKEFVVRNGGSFKFSPEFVTIFGEYDHKMIMVVPTDKLAYACYETAQIENRNNRRNK